MSLIKDLTKMIEYSKEGILSKGILKYTQRKWIRCYIVLHGCWNKNFRAYINKERVRICWSEPLKVDK